MPEHEKPLRLDMPFDEALRRFIQADPKEMKEEFEKSKKAKAKPPT